MVFLFLLLMLCCRLLYFRLDVMCYVCVCFMCVMFFLFVFGHGCLYLFVVVFVFCVGVVSHLMLVVSCVSMVCCLVFALLSFVVFDLYWLFV